MTFSVWGSFGTNTPTRDVFATETFTTLRALTPPPATLNVTINVDGGVTKGDGFGGIFYFDPNSVLPDDSVNVIAPTTGAGRWIRRDIVPGFNTFRKNAIINGGMEIAQRGTNFPAIANTTYSLDRWRYLKAGTMVHTLSQDVDVPTVAQAGQLFLNSLRLNLTTPQAIIGVNDFCFLTQIVEGYNWRALAQRPCTISFWVKATLPGVYAISLRNSDSGRTFVSPFTINLANTWEKKTITTDASTSSGVWNYSNGAGVELLIALVAGNTFIASTNNLWTGDSSRFITANQVNGVQAAAVDFRITGIQFEAGSLASEFERRTIQEEMILCQRYFEKSWPQGTAILSVSLGARRDPVQNNIPSAAIFGGESFKVTKRAVPIVVIYPFTTPTNISRVSDGNALDLAANSGVSFQPTDRQFSIINNSGGVLVPANGGLLYHWTADAEL